MKTKRGFAPGAERYAFDFGHLTYAKGWCQIDTKQDAPWFGTWTSPGRLAIFSYCEGDTTLQEAETPEEYVAALRDLVRWNDDHGHGPARIDPGFDPEMRAVFERLGIADLLH